MRIGVGGSSIFREPEIWPRPTGSSYAHIDCPLAGRLKYGAAAEAWALASCSCSNVAVPRRKRSIFALFSASAASGKTSCCGSNFAAPVNVLAGLLSMLGLEQGRPAYSSGKCSVFDVVLFGGSVKLTVSVDMMSFNSVQAEFA